MILRDGLLYEITHGLRNLDENASFELIRELELKVAEIALLSQEISSILEPTHNTKGE